MTQKNKLFIFGIIAPIIYVFAVLLGGIMISDYNHFTMAISELPLMAEESTYLIIIGLFSLYNLSVLFFGLALLSFNYKTEKIVASLIIVISICGVGMNIFTQDPINSTPTFAGNMHLFFAGITAPLTILCCFMLGLKSNLQMRSYKLFSIISGVVIFLFGGITVLSIQSNWGIMGVLERVTIGTFLIWIWITSQAYTNQDCDTPNQTS